MALFRALQGIAPHLDAAMVLNVCEGAGLIVTVRDDGGAALHYSDSIASRLGVDPQSTGGLRYFDESGDELASDELPHQQVRSTGEDVRNAITRIEGPAGSVWVQMSFTALAPGDAGYSVLGIGTDITARREAEVVLERMATHDGLTGLLNRVGLLQQVGSRFDLAATTGAAFAVALLDIDHFKAVNDTHGHAAGDAVLAAIAATVRSTLPPEAIAGRWGGEEFLIVCPGSTRTTALASAERLRIAVSEAAVPLAGLDGAPPGASAVVRVTVSLGVAADPGFESSFNELVRRADEALYAAKRDGRDRVAA